MMKIAVVLALAVLVCYAVAERCNNVTECVGTQCVTTAGHVHIECTEHHCTCSNDPQPCITANDCLKVRCIDKDAHTTNFHCLDGKCICLRT
ncbi:serine protease inhibitor Cvsi-2-like [Mercenaria mercenaria]|uniref:serine protease inhibitor Cvsi-2-like n=1 Tax=Mercenaria mercenaria TaxID=6596 RepID=UPI00234E4193|nr:serine protease inhibitor Cvsi-2-like [Mercenaria mercenaria]